MIKDEKGFADALLAVNEWWITGKSRKAERYPKKRSIFPNLEKELRSKRVVILTGPRRVGKSVLLHQLIQNLLDSGTSRDNIVYYQLDDPAISLSSDEPIKDILDNALSRSKNNRLYVFFDEVQAQKEWYKWIKSYYDRELDIKFILSGSSSLTIQADANKYLRGRTAEAELLPLDFREFLYFSGIEATKINKNDAVALSIARKQIEGALEEYLLVGGFPEWFEIKNEADSKERWLNHLLADVPKKAIYEDMAVYFNIRNPKVIDLLLNMVAVNQSRIISYEILNEVVGLDRATLLNYMDFLKSSYLILEIPVYGGPKKQMKAMKKYLLIDQGLRNSLMKNYAVKEENRGFIIENMVGLALFSTYKDLSYWREQQNEVDYVAGNAPIEVKYQNTIDEKDLKGLLKFLENKGGKYGVVISKDRLEEKTIQGKKISFIPFWLFLLDPKI